MKRTLNVRALMSKENMESFQDVDFDTVVTTNNVKYRVAGQALSQGAFALRIINENYTRRWAANYSANYIDDITQKTGCVKRISVFWKMLLDAAKGQSQSCTLQILTEDEMQELSHSRVLNDSGQKIYLLITQASEYDSFRYPLPVKEAPFTYEEYADTIKLLYEDNKNLQRSLADSDCAATLVSLEQKVEEYSEMLAQVRKQKDNEIALLKKQLKAMKAKLVEVKSINKPNSSAKIEKLRAPR